MTPLNRFDADIDRVSLMVSTADYVDSKSGGSTDSSDLRRAALTMAVSALDNYVHRRVQTALVVNFKSGAPFSAAGSQFEISLDAVRSSLSDPTYSWLEGEVARKHGYRSFQKPDSISSAIALVKSSKGLWSRVVKHSGGTEQQIRTDLTLIVDRRNQIVHESDCDLTSPSNLWPISTDDVAFAVKVVSAVVHGIEDHLA